MRAALLCLALAACAPPSGRAQEPKPVRHILVHGDVRFSADEREVIEAKAGELAAFTRGRFVLAFVWDWREDNFEKLDAFPHIVRREEQTARVRDIDDRAHGRTCGFVLGNEVAIIADRCTGAFPTIVLHELAHFAGLDHVSDAVAVMAPAPTSKQFTAADRAECVRVGVCLKGD